MPETEGRSRLLSLTWDALRTNAGLRKRLQVIFPLVGTAVASVAQVASKFTEDPASLVLNAISGVLIVVVLIVAALLAVSDRNGPEALAEAHAAHDETARRQNEIGDLQSDFQLISGNAHWLSVLYSVSLALREVVGPLLTEVRCDSAERDRYFASMLDLVLAQKADLFGIGDERWNLAVYIPSADGQALRCAACRRRDRDDEETPHREWPVGNGHVGRAYQDGELVTEDTQAPAMRGYFKTPPHLARPDDADRYRSIAAVPISLSGRAPSGVLIATSDIPGRFKPKDLVDGRDPVEPLRVLAAALAFVNFAAQTEDQPRSG